MTELLAHDVVPTTGCCDTCGCRFWRSYAGQTTCWDCIEDRQWGDQAPAIIEEALA